MLFVLAARIDKLATTATTDSRELVLAANAVLAEINEALIADVPGLGTNQEYYEYPDANNAWLASAESYQSGTGSVSYYWRQISNVAALPVASARNVRIRLVGEREAIEPNDPNTNADADGDGVRDARWFEVPGVMSSRGRPIYAAVRILDNGGMLNVNTGYKFDPTERDPNLVNGSSQLQVNLLALGKPSDSLSAREAALRAAPRLQPDGGQGSDRLRAAGALEISGRSGPQQCVSVPSLRSGGRVGAAIPLSPEPPGY